MSTNDPRRDWKLSGILGLLASGLYLGIFPAAAVAMASSPRRHTAGVTFGITTVIAGAIAQATFPDWPWGMPVVILGVAFLFVAYDARPSQMTPLITGMLALAGLPAMSVFVALAQVFPGEFPRLWQLISTPETLQTTHLTLLISTLAMGVGLVGLVPGAETVLRSVDNILRPIRESDEGTTIRVLMVVGGFAYLITVALRGVGYLGANLAATDYNTTLSGFVYLYYVAFYARIFVVIRSGKPDGLTAAWFLVTLALELVSGSKARFLTWVLLPTFYLYLLSKRRVGRKAGLVAGVTLALAALVVYPVLVRYRGDIERGDAQVENAVEGLQRASARSGDESEYLAAIEHPLFEGYSAEQALALTSIVHFHPERESWILFARLCGFWVPRFFWPSKPASTSGNEIGRLSWRVNPEDYGTSVLMTAPGELFVYLGTWGPLLMFLTGLLLRFTERLAAPNSEMNAIQAGFSTYLLRGCITTVGGAFEPELAGMLQQLVAFFIVLTFSAAIAKRFSGHSDKTANIRSNRAAKV